jgi:hypothetical protein
VLSCNLQAAVDVITTNLMLPDTDKNYPVLICAKYSWWNSDGLDTLLRYKNVNGNLYRMFWYDSINLKGHFLGFDI